MISAAAMIPFRAKAVKKVLVDAVVAPLRSDLGGGDERLHEKKGKKKNRHTFGMVGVMGEEERGRNGTTGWEPGSAMRSGSTS